MTPDTFYFTGRTAKDRKKKDKRFTVSETSSISSTKMEFILQKLKTQTTRNSTAENYLCIWRSFNNFLLKLDRRPPTWEHRLALYGAHLIHNGAQSAIVKSYFSAIKKSLSYADYSLKMDEVLVNSLTKACKIINDKVLTRLPIHAKLLEMLLFELQRSYDRQIYLQFLYKTIFCFAYYGLFRVGELTKSPHVIKAANVNIGINKNKILIILYSSKTHGKELHPQKVKISEIAEECKKSKRFFCPFRLARTYLNLRGNFADVGEQFFTFTRHISEGY